MNPGGMRGRRRSASPDFSSRTQPRDAGWANSARGGAAQGRGNFNSGPDSFRPPPNNNNFDPPHDRFSSAPFPSNHNQNQHQHGNQQNQNQHQHGNQQNQNYGGSGNGNFGGGGGRFDGPPMGGGGRGGMGGGYGGNQGGFQSPGNQNQNQNWGGQNQGTNSSNQHSGGWNNNSANEQSYPNQFNQGGGGREGEFENRNYGNYGPPSSFRGGPGGGRGGGYSDRGYRSPPGRGMNSDRGGGMSPRGSTNYRGGPDRGRGGMMSYAASPHLPQSYDQRLPPDPRERPTGLGGRRDEYRRNFDDDDGSYRGSGGGGREDYNAPRMRGEGGGGGEDAGRKIQDRVKKEKPCRTLFIRNLKFETSPEEVRGKFDMMGEVKTFFDLISNRGMVFITYYDLRAAMMAKDKLQGTEVTNRSIDVHYSLPRDADRAKRCDREKNQGSLTLQVPDARGPIIEQEIAARFGVCGDIRAIFPSIERPNERYIEFFDIRACQRAYDELNGAPLAGGNMDLRFAWDVMSPAALDPPMPPAGQPSATVGGYGSPASINAPIGSLNERLEQAQKVQQLLQSLGTLVAPPVVVPPPVTQSTNYPLPPNLALPARPYVPGSVSPLPSVPTSYLPPPTTVQPPIGVPPNVLAMLAAAQNSARSSPPPPPPPVIATTLPTTTPAADQVSALLALLAQSHATPPPR